MATDNHIRNPIEWGWDQLKSTGAALGATGRSVGGSEGVAEGGLPEVRQIEIEDLRDALRSGLADFGAYRTDVFFLCLIYPIVGLILVRFAFGYEMLPLIFPIMSGFALLGPVAAVGLYEISRRRERGLETSWADGFAVVGSPAFGAVVTLGIVLLAIFLAWLFTAHRIWLGTLGPEPPASVGAFVQSVFSTMDGWAMIVLGIGVGFLFALVVLAISVVSFPMLLDRHVSVPTAVATSLRAFARNPVPIGLWGLIVAAGLLIGMIPLLIGLAVVLPVLGHATWHLYRKLLPPPADRG